MIKTRIILLLASGVAVWLIFLLPMVVVDNESTLKPDSTPIDQAESSMHSIGSAEALAKISTFRSAFEAEKEPEKIAIFADSLAEAYAQVLKFDSAAWFSEKSAEFFNNIENWIEAGNLYFKAFSFALSEDKRLEMGMKTREIYESVLEKNPKEWDAKSNLAMTYVGGPDPMKPVMMLREILSENPQHARTLLNLGILSIQSGQFELAKSRFEQILKVDSTHSEATMLLGYTQVNLGDTLLGKALLKKVIQMDNDPLSQLSAENYLRELK